VTHIKENTLEVGVNKDCEVVINHPDLKPDENGVGHIVFTPAQARNLARILNKQARLADRAILANGIRRRAHLDIG